MVAWHRTPSVCHIVITPGTKTQRAWRPTPQCLRDLAGNRTGYLHWGSCSPAVAQPGHRTWAVLKELSVRGSRDVGVFTDLPISGCGELTANAPQLPWPSVLAHTPGTRMPPSQSTFGTAATPVNLCSSPEQWAFQQHLRKRRRSQALVAHACNPSYSGGRDQEARDSQPARANSL
jgi:hypothetical protein